MDTIEMTLMDYATGEPIRPATYAELVASVEAGDEGVILVLYCEDLGNRLCYVVGDLAAATVAMGEQATDADLADAIADAVDGLRSLSTEDLGGKVVDADAALRAIRGGEVVPYFGERGESVTGGLVALAMGVVMSDGPWWVAA
jgi:hypothetical protein